MLVPFRLYGLTGCPHCQSADQFLLDAKVPYQTVVADKDPVIMLGAGQVLGKEPEFPLLFSYITGEIVKGFNREEYERLVKVFRAMYGPGPADPPAAQGDNSGQAAQVVAEPAPAPPGTTPVPDVPGNVDSPDSAAPADSVQ